MTLYIKTQVSLSHSNTTNIQLNLEEPASCVLSALLKPSQRSDHTSLLQPLISIIPYLFAQLLSIIIIILSILLILLYYYYVAF